MTSEQSRFAFIENIKELLPSTKMWAALSNSYRVSKFETTGLSSSCAEESKIAFFERINNLKDSKMNLIDFKAVVPMSPKLDFLKESITCR